MSVFRFGVGDCCGCGEATTYMQFFLDGLPSAVNAVGGRFEIRRKSDSQLINASLGTIDLETGVITANTHPKPSGPDECTYCDCDYDGHPIANLFSAYPIGPGWLGFECERNVMTPSGLYFDLGKLYFLHNGSCKGELLEDYYTFYLRGLGHLSFTNFSASDCLVSEALPESGIAYSLIAYGSGPHMMPFYRENLEEEIALRNEYSRMGENYWKIETNPWAHYPNQISSGWGMERDNSTGYHYVTKKIGSGLYDPSERVFGPINISANESLSPKISYGAPVYKSLYDEPEAEWHDKCAVAYREIDEPVTASEKIAFTANGGNTWTIHEPPYEIIDCLESDNGLVVDLSSLTESEREELGL